MSPETFGGHYLAKFLVVYFSIQFFLCALVFEILDLLQDRSGILFE